MTDRRPARSVPPVARASRSTASRPSRQRTGNAPSALLDIRPAGAAVTAALHDRVDPAFASNVEVLIITSLDVRARSAPRDILALTGMTSGGVTRVLDRLEAHGLMVREFGRVQGDRRGTRLVLTPGGHRIATELATGSASHGCRPRGRSRSSGTRPPPHRSEPGPASARACDPLPLLRSSRRPGSAAGLSDAIWKASITVTTPAVACPNSDVSSASSPRSLPTATPQPTSSSRTRRMPTWHSVWPRPGPCRARPPRPPAGPATTAPASRTSRPCVPGSAAASSTSCSRPPRTGSSWSRTAGPIRT